LISLQWYVLVLTLRLAVYTLFAKARSNLGKNFLHPQKYALPYTYHKYGGISESHASKDCVKPIILDAELYKTCPGERVLVVMTHQVQCNIPTFEALLQ